MGTPASCCITSLVGTRHKVNKREPSVHEATPGGSAIAAGTQTNIWHPSEARLEARGLEENGFLQTRLCPKLLREGRTGQSQAARHQYSCYSLGIPIPEVQGPLR